VEGTTAVIDMSNKVPFLLSKIEVVDKKAKKRPPSYCQSLVTDEEVMANCKCQLSKNYVRRFVQFNTIAHESTITTLIET